MKVLRTLKKNFQDKKISQGRQTDSKDNETGRKDIITWKSRMLKS